MQDRVAVPEPCTVFGVIPPLQLIPEGSGVSDRDTIPANPFSALIVIVEIAGVPSAGTGAGEVAVITKSTKLNVAVAVWVREPLVPVIVTVKGPAVEELQDKVADTEPVTLPGAMALQLRPAGMISVKATLPGKAFRAVTNIVEEAEEPIGAADGKEAASEKSTTWKVIGAVVRDTVPFVPVTVTA